MQEYHTVTMAIRSEPSVILWSHDVHTGYFINNSLSALLHEYCSAGRNAYNAGIKQADFVSKLVFKLTDWKVLQQSLAKFYAPIPWTLEQGYEPIPDHFAHISETDPTKIAYTENDAKGGLNIQTIIKPGRYLTKFFPHLSSETIKAMVNEVDKGEQIKFASTPEDIVNIYINGPPSCMSYAKHKYSKDGNDNYVHPCHVYGAGDIHLAYLPNGEGKASSRALVNHAEMTYTRIYGDDDRMTNALTKLGFTQSNSALKGLKMLRIPSLGGEGYIAPYLDGEYTNAYDDGDYLIICGDDDDDSDGFSCQSTNGTTIQGEKCACCDKRTNENDMCGTDDGPVCAECFTENYNECCGYGGFVHNNNGTMIDDNFYSDAYIRNHRSSFVTCVIDGCMHHKDDCKQLASGDYIYDGYIDHNCSTCSGNGGLYLDTDISPEVVEDHDGTCFSEDFIDTCKEVEGLYYIKLPNLITELEPTPIEAYINAYQVQLDGTVEFVNTGLQMSKAYNAPHCEPLTESLTHAA